MYETVGLVWSIEAWHYEILTRQFTGTIYVYKTLHPSITSIAIAVTNIAEAKTISETETNIHTCNKNKSGWSVAEMLDKQQTHWVFMANAVWFKYMYMYYRESLEDLRKWPHVESVH